MSANGVSILLIVLCLNVVVVDCRLVSVPDNNAAVVGNNTTFNCRTNNTDSSVEWLLVGLNNKNITFTVYNGSDISPMFADRFSVLTDNHTGCYDLVITNTSQGDAGTYTCVEQETRDNASAVYIVIAQEPFCSINPTAVKTLLGDVINMTCYVMFNGTIWQRPQMAWYFEDQLLKNDSYLFEPNVEVWSNLTVAVELPVVRSHKCVTYFSALVFSDDEPVNLSRSIPALNFTWLSPVVQVAPVNTTITGPIVNNTISVNDHLTCSTQSLIAPSRFQWLDVSADNETNDKTDTTDGQVFTARNAGLRMITCIVYSTLRDVTCNDTAYITVYVTDAPKHVFTTAEIVGIAVGAFCLTFIVFVCIFCIVRRRRQRHPYRQMDEDAADVGRSSVIA